MKSYPLTGLVAATHTPFHADGSLHLAIVEKQAAHLSANGVKFAFIGGSRRAVKSTCISQCRRIRAP